MVSTTVVLFAVVSIVAAFPIATVSSAAVSVATEGDLDGCFVSGSNALTLLPVGWRGFVLEGDLDYVFWYDVGWMGCCFGG